MNSIVGFTASLGLDTAERERRDRAQALALGHFPWLTRRTLQVGEAELQLWGHGSLDEFIVGLEDGGLFVVAGAPVGEFSPQAVRESLASLGRAEDFELPWDGRLTALRVSGDGRSWAAWDDWAGSIPLFHARAGKGRVASTLEPAVVAACGFTPADFSPPALLSLLVHGHYLGDWTLFRDMHLLPPDSAAEWDGEGGFRRARQWTIRATQERWESGWDELIDEMHALFRRALADALKAHPSWTLPLSGGLDSRLIAAVGRDVGVEFRAYTYGELDAIEAIHAREVAKRLRIPWQHVPIPADYLARHTRTWLEWFGSALHCHGMYQMPFLEAVRDVDLPIVTGFTGDPLGGAQTKKMMGGPAGRTMLDRLMDKWRLCSFAEAEALMGERFAPALEEMQAELERQEREMEGSLYQRAWLIFQWNHVSGFSYYQPLMYDYWKGVGTPFVNRSLARFCLSLPRCALDHRRLQKEMLLRHFPEMASVGGTFGDRVAASPAYIVKRRIAERLPYRLRRGPLQEFGPNWTKTEERALSERGAESLWPLDRVRADLGGWLDTNVVEDFYRRAAGGDSTAYDQLRAVQAVAWHFVPAEGARREESQARAAL